MSGGRLSLASITILTTIALQNWDQAQASDHGTKQHYWIALRSDGRPGRGTKANPFDGSTQAKFDRILRKFWSKRTENLVFHLGAGVFETVGNGGYIAGLRELGEGWRCLSGWEIRGSGQDRTILKLTKQYEHGGNWGSVGIATHDSFVNNVVVQDLTIDCNHSAIGKDKSSEAGVSLHGSGHTIRRVTVRNVAGKGYEGFPIGIGSHGVDSSQNLIEDCTITDWKGGTGGSVTISNNVNNFRPPLTSISGIVRRNRVIGTQIGYGGWGMKDVIFEDNLASDCAYGSNIDSMQNSRVIFRNNRFVECRNFGMAFANCEAILLQNNTLSLRSQGPVIYLLNDCADFRVEDNRFVPTDPAIPLRIVGTRAENSFRGTFDFLGNEIPPNALVQVPGAGNTGH